MLPVRVTGQLNTTSAKWKLGKMSSPNARLIPTRKEKQMFEFKTLIVTKRGSRKDGVEFVVSKFPVSSQEQVDAILRHPSIAGWKYGYSVGMSRE